MDSLVSDPFTPQRLLNIPKHLENIFQHNQGFTQASRALYLPFMDLSCRDDKLECLTKLDGQAYSQHHTCNLDSVFNTSTQPPPTIAGLYKVQFLLSSQLIQYQAYRHSQSGTFISSFQVNFLFFLPYLYKEYC